MKNWKTTAAGILSALLGMSGPATALLAALQAMKPTPDYTLAVWGAVLTFAFGVLRVWLGLVQNDAQDSSEPQLPPGQAVKSGIYTTGPKLGALALIAVALPLMLGLTGCPANQSQLQKAATASEQAMVVVQGFQQGEILAYNQGKACELAGTPGCVVISDADHLFIQQSVETIATLDKTTNACIRSAGTSAAAVSCASTAIASIAQLQADGDLHIKSATAKQDFDLAMIGAKTALNVISTILGGN